MPTRAILLILGLFHAVNGVYMLVAPQAWFKAVPGVSGTGPMNHHFVADIGLAFLASGVGLALGALRRPWAPPLAAAGATWPALHALLHIAGWIAHGLPATAAILVSEGLGVVGVGALGGALAWIRVNQRGTAQ